MDERISIVFFYVAILPAIWGFAVYLSNRNIIKERRYLKRGVYTVTCLCVASVLFSIVTTYTGDLPTILQRASTVGTFIGICISLLSILITRMSTRPETETLTSVYYFFDASLIIFLIAVSSYMFFSENSKFKPQESDGLTPVRLSIYDLKGSYSGRMKTKELGDITVHLNISRIIAEEDSIVFDYSIMTDIKTDIAFYEGKGRIYMTGKLITFDKIGECSILIKENTIELESAQNEETYSHFTQVMQ